MRGFKRVGSLDVKYPIITAEAAGRQTRPATDRPDHAVAGNSPLLV